MKFPFDNTYARLPDHFHSRVNPTPVAAPQLIQLNSELATALGLDPTFLSTQLGVEILAGNRIAHGSEPIALAYAGHQFGNFVPQLGDGRANLLGEVVAPTGLRYDLQLKGSGPTPFSRRGDGRAALGPVLREYLVSEAMFALGVPTTRALSAVLSGEPVYRETALPGAIITRVASSHLRVGTFEFFAAREDLAGLRTLAHYALHRHYPTLAATEHPFTSLLAAVVGRQAHLIAHWMSLGFIHGVMNTDNTSISGETIDYGPCAFLEAYDPRKRFSSIDLQGRYAYANQPFAAHWNLVKLAEALLPIIAEEHGSDAAGLDAAREAIDTFEPTYETARLHHFRRKLGLLAEEPGDGALVEDLLARMASDQLDFTQTFRALNDGVVPFDDWAAQWRARQAAESTSAVERAAAMRLANPTYIPRNHLIQAVINAALDRQDFAPFRELLSVVTRPLDLDPAVDSKYLTPARPEQQIRATYCGT